MRERIIVTERADAPPRQLLTEVVTSIRCYDEEVPDWVSPRRHGGHPDSVAESGYVDCRDLGAPPIPALEMPQSHPQDGGLELVEARIQPFELRHVALSPPVVPDPPHR